MKLTELEQSLENKEKELLDNIKMIPADDLTCETSIRFPKDSYIGFQYYRYKKIQISITVVTTTAHRTLADRVSVDDICIQSDEIKQQIYESLNNKRKAKTMKENISGLNKVIAALQGWFTK